MKILAKSTKGKEFMYSRSGVVQIPGSWNDTKVNAFIEGLNKFFRVADNETYYPHTIDEYDIVQPDYKAAYRKGKATLTRIQ